MSSTIDDYMKRPYKIMIEEDKSEGGYVISCPELKGCMTCSSTIEEGLSQLEDAKYEWFSACIRDAVPIPEPSQLTKYSGQFKLRLPKSLHMALSEKSTEEGVSMNQYCVYLLSKGIEMQ